MIITVTMNPAMDKTVEVDKLLLGGLNRLGNIELDAGGKGINVSKTIAALGGKSIATGFLGGGSGQGLKKILDDLNIENDFVWIQGESRTNTKVLEQDGSVTELNEPGPWINPKELEELLQKIKTYAKEGNVIVLSGSIPQGVDADIYKKIIEMAQNRGAKVLLDADGPLFAQGIQASPKMVKPNHLELAAYLELKDASKETLLQAAKEMQKQGIEQVAISRGKEGALFLMGDYTAACNGLQVVAHSTVGAGDAMVAALAYAYDLGLCPEETVRLAMATSAGAVTTIGTKPPAKELVEELKENVKIEKLK